MISLSERKPFLGLGQNADAQYRLSISALIERGLDVVSVDIDDPPDFAISIDDGSGSRFWLNGQVIVPESYWCRLKFFNTPLKAILSQDYEGVRRTEWLAFSSGLSHILCDRILHNESLSAATSKLAQLAMAGQAGFAIPSTISGVGQAGALQFADKVGSVVIKGLHATNLVRPEDPEATDVFITTEISRREMAAADPEEFRSCPYFIQEKVDTSNEHRVIAFGDRIFCYKLVERGGVNPLVDRRVLKPHFELVETPPILPQLVARYFSAANLSYGVFDLVFERSEILFLECNPEGQWHSANEINLREVVTAFADWNESGRGVSTSPAM